ncbi:DUF4129 domain-containing transglutaminase family protein [Peribacillus sp. NJ11]|uniref:DUF4129 domain-containing transglutaminase family protein n=1 Tax=Peribacillus sp. NJ11 TaxID=3055861 RepID=UPI0025A208D8|nr:DUF4129 domain-containing transglutaminase family protein [Peribacillus sp. NJ11]MDM5219905.1 DUF4129 domain-containing transglutaminase family protein [Peribacillus sp. NJ11]
MNVTTEKLERFMHVLLYIFGLLLITEWLRPVDKLTDTGNIIIFVLFLIYSLLLHYFRIHWSIRIILIIAYIMISLQFLHSKSALFQLSWLKGFLVDFTGNLGYMYDGNWESITNPFRTFLFFVLLWLVTYLIHYWVMVRQSIFFFFMLTVIFISVLDTFTPYVGDKAMVRIIIIGFLMLGLLSLLRLTIQERIRFPMTAINKWILMLTGMILVSVLVGFGAPKLSPQWADPVPYITSYSDKAVKEDGGSKGKSVGYDEDDSDLGGSIEPDSSIVFYNNAPAGHYWKVENKDIYTGKGWVSIPETDFHSFSNGQDMTSLDIKVPEVEKTEEMTAKVTMTETYSHILHPQSGYLKKIEAKNGMDFKYYQGIDKIISERENGERLVMEEYELVYDMPSFDIAELRKITEPDETMDLLMEKNTQLPEGLPNRIYELGSQLTRNETNWYDKAKAIEDYFDGPEFIYSKDDIPYPGTNQDYVDQFLFETQIGYCDNFSSAMVVLLRAANIPARWVKGYTEGEKSIHDGESVYKVTNNNAHSWAEVYFSGIGWVPFEPTKGFNGEVEFYDSELKQEKIKNPGPTNEEQTKKETRERQDTPDRETQSSGETGIGGSEGLFKWTAITLLGVMILASIGYFFRRKWIPHLQILRYKNKTGAHFTKAYLILLKQLKRAGLVRPEGQTLREYAAYVDAVYDTDEMSELTAGYELMIYRGDVEDIEWEHFQNGWESLMKKTSS